MINLGKLTIKSRLAGGLGIIIAFMVVLIIIGIWSLKNINNRLEEIIKINNTKIQLAQAILSNVRTIDGGVLIAAIENDSVRAESKRKAILDTRVAFKKNVEQLEKLEDTKKG